MAREFHIPPMTEAELDTISHALHLKLSEVASLMGSSSTLVCRSSGWRNRLAPDGDRGLCGGGRGEQSTADRRQQRGRRASGYLTSDGRFRQNTVDAGEK
jgi:hypothetical protein